MRPAGSPGHPGLQEEMASQLRVDWLWATWTWGLGDSGSGLRRRLRTVQACGGSWRPRSALPLPWDPRGLPLPSANPLRGQKGLCPPTRDGDITSLQHPYTLNAPRPHRSEFFTVSFTFPVITSPVGTPGQGDNESTRGFHVCRRWT